MEWKKWLLAFSIAVPGIAHSNALTLNKGTIRSKHYFLYYGTDHVWDRQGKRQQNYNRFDRYEAGAILQYGLTCRDMVTLQGAYNTVDEALDGRHFGFSDIELSIKHQIKRTPGHAYALEITTIIPVGKGYKPAIRYGVWGFEGMIHDTCSFTLCSTRFILNNSLGYRWYQGYPSDQVRHRLSLCLPLLSCLSLKIGSAIDFGLFNGKDRFNQSRVYLNPNYRLWKGEVAALFHFGRHSSLSLGYFQHLLGQNVGTSGGIQGTFTLTF